MSDEPWWRDAVFYEIYVRSFADSDGDGVGDLPGVRGRLPYLGSLGVDALWLTPFYPSPGVDQGYDVSDYCAVDPQFGTLADFDALVADAHALGLRIVVDLVPNHTSIEHPWFREHPEYYVWRDEPNNWLSVFGGPAWHYDERRGRYYLHLFAPEQPDLDWHDANVQREFDDVLRFWLVRGVDGFRVDVAHGLFKDPELRDEDEPVPGAELHSFDRRRAIDRPEVHPLYRRWRAAVDEGAGERVLVGEVFFRDPDRVAAYVRPDELHLVFNFTLLFAEWDADALRAAIDRSLASLERVGATATWVLESHDVTRLPTRYGGGPKGLRRARAGLLLLLALPGAAFLYQGQELGLPEVELADDERRDPIFFRTNGARVGRDGCRVPLPWTSAPPGYGFTAGTPWLPPPAGWGERSVEAQDGAPGSTLELTRAALAARPRGRFEWRETPTGALAFARAGVLCTVNVSGAPLECPGEVLLASEPVEGTVPADAAVWTTIDEEQERA
ncbi:MAG TPA: alpha-amylase family glycosyl hydrolase [Gaiellaceae bacterium]|nr:alpha-amylase family glycosyl hydrolase [Gaiellaceae bacterium]